MTLKVLFFCGHKSPYGLAHLIPILESRFDVIAVVVATEDRWDCFRETLSGKSYYRTESARSFSQIIDKYIKGNIKRVLSEKFIRLFRKDYKKDIKIPDILRTHNISLLQVFDVNEKSFVEKVKELNPDLILSAAYPQIFSKDLIAIPHKGSINFHPSLLPKYRGAHPHFWAIAKGEKKSGQTAHFMTEKIDDGDIVAQIEYPIEGYSYSQHYQKIIEEVPTLVRKVEEFFYQNKKAVPQNLLEGSYFRNDREVHWRIFWCIHSAEDVANLSRTEKAFCFFRGVKVKFIQSYVTKTNRNLTNNVQVETGTIIDVNKECLIVKTKDACINIEVLEECGKKIPAIKWVQKHRVNIGEKFD